MAKAWLYQAQRGRRGEEHERGPGTTLDAAYDQAEKWFDEGHRVTIILYTALAPLGAVADTRESDRHDGEWVVGRERWRANEAKRMAEK